MPRPRNPNTAPRSPQTTPRLRPTLPQATAPTLGDAMPTAEHTPTAMFPTQDPALHRAVAEAIEAGRLPETAESHPFHPSAVAPDGSVSEAVLRSSYPVEPPRDNFFSPELEGETPGGLSARDRDIAETKRRQAILLGTTPDNLFAYEAQVRALASEPKYTVMLYPKEFEGPGTVVHGSINGVPYRFDVGVQVPMPKSIVCEMISIGRCQPPPGEPEFMRLYLARQASQGNTKKLLEQANRGYQSQSHHQGTIGAVPRMYPALPGENPLQNPHAMSGPGFRIG